MRKSFSLMLAWRYLNPRRAWISSITMISVLGVLLGVLVLVVVMAVYAGLEREQKRRLLGFSPHILLQYSETGGRLTTIENWGEVIERMKNIPGVVTAYPHVEDNAVLDSEDMQRPVSYQGLETNDPLQLKGVEDMLDLEHYPGSTADMGLDARVVVSSIMAAQYQWKLGDKINLYSTRNLQQVLRGYKSAEQPVVRERFSDKIKAVGELIEKQWLENDEGFTMNRAMIDVLNQLYEIEQTADLRGNEHETILGMLAVVDAATLDKDNDTFHFAAGSKEEFSLHWKKILGTSQDELDAQVLKNLKDIVLPREVEIVGVFQSSQMVKMPDAPNTSVKSLPFGV